MSNKFVSIRDFSGGWNVADNPYNLNSKYQTISDNIVVGVDGSLSPRQGYKAYANLKQGVVTSYPAQSFTVTTTNAFTRHTINWTGHPFVTGDHVTFSFPITVGGITINGTYGVIKNDANSFFIYTRNAATSAVTSGTQTQKITRDTHMMGGNPLDAAFFQGKIVVFDDIGEIHSIDATTNTITRIWDVSKAAALSGGPTGWRKQSDESALPHVSFDTFKQTLIAVNGRNNDKPIEINFNRLNGAAVVQFLVDPASNSNSFVYAADFVQSFDGYVLLYASNNTATPSSNTITTLDISAAGTSGVFVGNTAPDDAVQLDLGRVTQTVEPRITGIANLRDRVFVAFPDSAMIGKLGAYNGTKHSPDFSDQVPQHGALNHRVIHNIGNDLLMCDYAGVPAFSQSQTSGMIVPERLSQLIDPELNKHLSRLSANTLRYKVWALFNIRDRQYMLFIPKHDSASVFNGSSEPFYVLPDFRTDPAILVNAPNHTVSAGDYVDVTGAVGITGLTAANINGRRQVTAIVDKDYFLMSVGAIPTANGVSGGGSAVVFTPVNDETITYVYQYHPAMRIKRWTRFRGWNFSCGTLANDGRVFLMSDDGYVWQLGTIDRPIYADRVGDPRLDANTYPEGVPINWVAETPWSDFSDRMAVKVGQQIIFDIQGTERFNFSMFVDNIYDDRSTYKKSPAAQTTVTPALAMVAGDATGFGGGIQNYGLGRRANEQFLFHYPFRCKLAKLRFQGSTTGPIRIISVTFMFQKGSIYR